jgi:hypothetical protein
MMISDTGIVVAIPVRGNRAGARGLAQSGRRRRNADPHLLSRREKLKSFADFKTAYVFGKKIMM